MFTFSINGFKKFDLGNDDGTFDAIYFDILLLNSSSQRMLFTYGNIVFEQVQLWQSTAGLM